MYDKWPESTNIMFLPFILFDRTTLMIFFYLLGLANWYVLVCMTLLFLTVYFSGAEKLRPKRYETQQICCLVFVLMFSASIIAENQY